MVYDYSNKFPTAVARPPISKLQQTLYTFRLLLESMCIAQSAWRICWTFSRTNVGRHLNVPFEFFGLYNISKKSIIIVKCYWIKKKVFRIRINIIFIFYNWWFKSSNWIWFNCINQSAQEYCVSSEIKYLVSNGFLWNLIIRFCIVVFSHNCMERTTHWIHWRYTWHQRMVLGFRSRCAAVILTIIFSTYHRYHISKITILFPDFNYFSISVRWCVVKNIRAM